jgi:hypothetical protein
MKSSLVMRSEGKQLPTPKIFALIGLDLRVKLTEFST